MQLFLARHGNTFQAGQPVTWVGSQNNLPLVEAGIEQAKQLGRALLKAKINPTVIYTGPLKRMIDYGNIVLNEIKLNLELIVDSRLNEIDYGKWGGLTTNEICHRFGVDEFERWEKYSQWPQNGEWGESAELLSKRIGSFATDLTQKYNDNEVILIVGSNGCLRFFLDLIPGELQKHIATQTTKIATGSICKLIHDPYTSWKVDFWNISPNKLL